ncbi:MAG: DUF3416 domain-containing protein [Methylibium sp.]|uniref:alpha-1,4-glucan--maltose-1-phosphate maltosyltransferase n=1 Tax=Methylibium sp. TaxID=2067992 RepID=UPI00182EB70E|nr:maltotransferase domain-containing protein [Methylibium sp.]MBA3598860.1 DUF3416 domain-containing protein [Methylibium sp.]
MSRALRILRVDPAALQSSDDLRQACAHGRRLGFDQLSLAWSPASAAPGSLHFGEGEDRERIAALASECQAHGLGLLIDAAPARASRGSTLAAQHPQWFVPEPDGDLPDPRRPAHCANTVTLSSDAGQLEPARDWWAAQMAAWLEAGAAGLYCVHEAGLPKDFWTSVLDALRTGQTQSFFVAGASAEASALADCGFDAIAGVVPGSAAEVERWTCEHELVAAGSAPLGMLAEARRHPVCATTAAEDPEQVHRRSLWWAAATGTGLIMPLGFERGVSSAQALRPNGGEFDLGAEVMAANAWLAERGVRNAAPRGSAPRLSLLSAAGAPAVAVLITDGDLRRADRALLLLAGFPGAGRVAGADVLPGADRFARFRALRHTDSADVDGVADAAHCFDPTAAIDLPAGRVALYESLPVVPTAAAPTRAAAAANRARRALDVAVKAPRVAIEAITPSVDDGRFVVKRIAGETVRVEADVFMDGHDKLAVMLLWRGPDEAAWQEVPMAPLGNDRWRAEFPLTKLGRHAFTVEAWRDGFETYRDELSKKVAAGLDVSLELEEGRLLVVQAQEHASTQEDAETAATLEAVVALLGPPLAAKAAGKKTKARSRRASAETAAPPPQPDEASRVETLLAAPTQQAVRNACLRPFALRHDPPLGVDAERTAARYASWYELFPRSLGNRTGEPLRHGRFDDVVSRLPAIRAMGFDVVYFTPIHPIGQTNRKGRNNTLTPTPEDPGSPYAIGSEEGGHDAIHSELGTLEDFLRLCKAATAHGLEIALDFAIQCSPDHPWLREHPEWFSWRPDGSMRYAENPPKKYQDIVNVDFYADGARPALWTALRDVVLFWVKQGVRLFRVDNPHTKPLPFWEWMIGDVRARHPDVVFLSEAFTRPKPMYRLAKVGFSQSYTYFTWRHTKKEFTDYLTELNQPPVSDVFRPHFFVNTPDINPHFLQASGRAGFLIRAALATTLSGLWGMYSGFELCEGAPLPGKEEYLDSEKFELRAWDWQRPGNINAEITLLNRIRRGNPALQSHLGIEFLHAGNDNILYFAKAMPGPVARAGGRFTTAVVLVAINLDPFNAHEADIELPLWRFGLPDDGALDTVDLVHDHRFVWRGKHQHIRLDPAQLPFAIWRIQPTEAE